MLDWDRALDRRIRTLNGYANLSISEQGIHCLFLVFGFIKWFESADSSKEIRSPLILVQQVSQEIDQFTVGATEAEDDVVDNLCLRQRFKQDFGLELPPLPELDQLEEDGARLAYLEEVRKTIIKNERWRFEDRCCLEDSRFRRLRCGKISGTISNQSHQAQFANRSVAKALTIRKSHLATHLCCPMQANSMTMSVQEKSRPF